MWAKCSSGESLVHVSRCKVTPGHRRNSTQLAANLASDALLKKAKMKKVVYNRMNGSDVAMNFEEKGAIVITCVCSRAT